LEKLSAFRPVRPLLKQIACGSLCRIYSQFPKDKLSSLDVLYEKKYTINNDLRMIIPIDRKTGVVMISYTDNRFADEWHALEKEESIEAVDAKIAGLVRDTLDITLPKPIKTKVFYWPCGVGYWKVGANSLAVSKRIIQPFSGEKVYVCGEHYSEKNQQWIEGALETSERMLDRFWSF
jgi:monoamine oxidase